MDTYVECLVRRKNSQLCATSKIVCIILAVLCVFLGAGFGFIALIAAAVFAGLAYLAHMNIIVEYEYLYAEKEISVDKIWNFSRRKNVANYPLEKMEVFAPIKSWHLGEYKNTQGKEKDYSIGYEANPDERYVMIMEGGEKVILSPSPAFVEMVRNHAPRKTFVD